MAEARVALISPPGEGAIGVVQLWGGDASRIIEKVFRPARRERFARRDSRHLYYGKIHRAGETVDEVIVAYISANDSPFGEELYEINCHGGSAAVEGVIELLTELGARRLSWRQAVGAEDSLRKEALIALVYAQTDLAARVFLKQAMGALSEALKRISDAIEDAKRLLSGKAKAIAVRKRLEETRSCLERLLRTYSLGSSLLQSKRIVFIGSPNVGKSSLANALLGEERSIVQDEPGTTRDLVISKMVLRGHSVELVDTAGLSPAAQGVELEGMRRTSQVLREAALTLFILDGSRSLSRNELDFLRKLDPQKSIAVINKIDLAGPLKPEDLSPGYPGRILRVSALTGEGLEKLHEALVSSFAQDLSEEIGAVVFSRRQKELLSRLQTALGHSLDALSTSLDISLSYIEEALKLVRELFQGTVSEDEFQSIISGGSQQWQGQSMS